MNTPNLQADNCNDSYSWNVSAKLNADLFLYTIMLNLVAFLTDERGCANLLRKIRWPGYNRNAIDLLKSYVRTC